MARQKSDKQGDAAEPLPITASWAASVLPRRTSGAHKWGVGGVVIVAGSPAFAGAAALCCAAAGRSGAGIVSAALPRSVAQVVVGLVPEVTVVILPEGESASVAARAAGSIQERLERSTAMVVGPGLGNDEATAALLGALFGFSRARPGIGFGSVDAGAGGATTSALAESGKPVVVDADALNWLASQDQWWQRFAPGQLVLTPHPGEMARLLDAEAGDVAADPMNTARDAAVRWGQTVVLKSGQTVVASPDGTVFAADSPPCLATAGSGDVLSGSIGAFLAQGLGPQDAAALAVFVGARAADRLSQRFGTLGVVAGDLPRAIAEELSEIEALGA